MPAFAQKKINTNVFNERTKFEVPDRVWNGLRNEQNRKFLLNQLQAGITFKIFHEPYRWKVTFIWRVLTKRTNFANKTFSVENKSPRIEKFAASIDGEDTSEMKSSFTLFQESKLLVYRKQSFRMHSDVKYRFLAQWNKWKEFLFKKEEVFIFKKKINKEEKRGEEILTQLDLSITR